MDFSCHRRDAMRLAGGALLSTLTTGTRTAEAQQDQPSAKARGCVVGQPLAAKAGAEVLAAGGNAVDAAVAAALVAGVVAVPSCGIGGYGGDMGIPRPQREKGHAPPLTHP